MEDYINGLEAGVNMVKAIFELPVDKRKKFFGSDNVANILDKFDFIQIHELIRVAAMPTPIP